MPNPRRHSSSCDHCRDVDDYRGTVIVDELRMEADTALHPADIELWLAVHTMITFKAWLIGKRR